MYKFILVSVTVSLFYSCLSRQSFAADGNLYSTYTGEWTPVKVSQGDGDSLVKKVIHRF